MESKKLYCIDKRERNDFDHELVETMHKCWDSMKPNPNTTLSRTVKDRETGEKIKHCHLNIDGHFKSKYNDWIFS